jgi:hypothetical protein
MKIKLTEQKLVTLVLNVIKEAGGKIYATNKNISKIAKSNNTDIGSGIMRSNGRFTTWQKTMERMDELNPQIRNSMIQTYAKSPFHFWDTNESDIVLSIELRVLDIINITRDEVTLLCQRIYHGETKNIRVRINFKKNSICYRTNFGIKQLEPDKRYISYWNIFFNQLKSASSSMDE